jgi:putative restriction endonuclease
MAYHVFNIGAPSTTAWWQENLDRGVITSGWDGDPGDRGEVVLRDMDGGDWVLAFASGYGFISAGIVAGLGTYVLHPGPVAQSESTHQHERAVRWVHAVQDLKQAVTIAEAGRHAPRQTKERERDEGIAERIIALIARHAAVEAARTDAAPHKYWHVFEAVQAIGGPVTVKVVTEWLAQHYPEEDHSDARDNACLLSVNDANRRHHDHGRRDFRSDHGNPKDVLFREGRYRNVAYVLYDRRKHGIWDLQRDADGNTVAVQVESNLDTLALADAEDALAQDMPAINSEHDAREWALRAVAMRRGQQAFRASLIAAYGNQCAITGCAIVEILEAAHVRGYLGDYTHRVDNGLLLRADLHTLFDLHRIWVDDEYVVRVAISLRGTEYERYDGQRLRLPKQTAHQPKREHLAHHRLGAETAGAQ